MATIAVPPKEGQNAERKFYTLDWENRKRAQWHKRLLLSAAILVMMGPAIGRLPLAPPTRVGITILLLLGLALFIPLFMWDRRRDGHAHPATWIGFSLSAIAVFVPLFVFWTGVSWAAVAAKLPGVGTCAPSNAGALDLAPNVR